MELPFCKPLRQTATGRLRRPLVSPCLALKLRTPELPLDLTRTAVVAWMCISVIWQLLRFGEQTGGQPVVAIPLKVEK